MDLLFVFIAACPAVIVTKYGLKEDISWKQLPSKFAGWFYCISFLNLLLLYQQGWGSFEFTSWPVRFLIQYMVNNVVIIVVILIGKKIKLAFHTDKE